MDTISCGKLSMGVVGLDCNNPLIMGVKPNAIIINHDDIDNDPAKTVIKDGVIEKLTLKSDPDPTSSAGFVERKGFLAQTLNDGISTNTAFAKGAYYNGWDQNFTLRLFDNTNAVKDFVNQLSRSRVVVIVENKHVKYSELTEEAKNRGEIRGETVYEVYGFYTGLELNEATRDSTDADTKGGYVLTLGCDENSKEPSLPISFFDKDLTTTKEQLEKLYHKD